jgi:type IV pilus assembly protein PilB
MLLEELVNRGLVREDQVPEIVKTAENKYNGDIDRSLIDYNISEDLILEIKGSLYNIPIKKINPDVVTSSVLKIIPGDTAKTYRFVPIGIVNNVLEIGIVDPENVQAIDVLTFITAKLEKPFKLYLISESAYNKILEKYDALGTEVGQVLTELDQEIALAGEEKGKVKEEKDLESKSKEEEKITEDAPIIKIVAVILRHATEGSASDIHIEHAGDKIKVRFRVDGVLHTSLTLPISVYNGVVARIKILSKLRLDEKRKPQDGGFSAKMEGRKIDFRVSTMPSYYGEKIVMRILDSEKGVKPLNDLYMSAENLALVREALDRPYGLILMTGPTGSGKTTSLYSMLNELDHEKENIVSLEDPVEYHMDGINQSQVAPEIGYTFASGLRSILRQDPDIIMVGEIRDKETAELAIQAALTGHLVLSTLHTNSAIGAIPRLIDMGIDPYLIAPTLILCMAQRLARKIYPDSKQKVKMDEPTKLMIDKNFEDLPIEFKSKISFGDFVYEASPAPECPSGMLGRVPVYEMFKIDKDMQNVILKNPQEQEIYKLARSRGMLTIREDAIVKSIEGLIPFKEVYNF